MRAHLALMGVVTVLTLTGLAILGFSFDPLQTSVLIHGLFFTSLFIFFVSFGTLMFYFGSVVWIKVNRSGKERAIAPFETYLFRGFLFAGALAILIVIKRIL